MCACLVSDSCFVCRPVLALYALPSQSCGVSALQASGCCLCLAGQGKSVCINIEVVLAFWVFFRISVSNFCNNSEKKGGTAETEGESC